MPSSHAAAPGNVACEGGLVLEFTDPVLKLCHVLMMLLAGGQPRVVQSRATLLAWRPHEVISSLEKSNP